MGVTVSKSVRFGAGRVGAYVYGSARGVWTGLRFGVGGFSVTVGKNIKEIIGFLRPKTEPAVPVSDDLEEEIPPDVGIERKA